MIYTTNVKDFLIRDAGPSDSGQIVSFIQELAIYEKFESLLTLTEEKIQESLFNKCQAHCLIAEYCGKAVGFSIYYFNYSILTAQANMHMEALFVTEAYRGRGFGGAIMQCVARIAEEHGCQRLDWACLKWNTSVIGFYRSIGAYPLDDRDIYRLDGANVHRLAYRQASEQKQ